MAQNITLLGASYSDVPAVTLPKTGGGTASFTDVTDTTATASDVAAGTYFYTAAGVRTEGTGSGGGGVIVTQTQDAGGGTIVEITATPISGTKSITANGTGIDVSTYQYADVAVPAPTPTLQTVTKSYTPSESQQTEAVTYGTGYDGIDTVNVTVGAISSTYVGSGVTQRASADLSANGATVTAPAGYYASAATKTISSGSATPASSISATGATVSTGTNTLTLSKSSVSNTPQVSAGYISSGTAGNSSVSLTASVTTKAAATYYAGTSDQTINASQYLTGTQTIKAVSQTNLAAENIKSGTTVSISNGNGNIWSVTGTYTGGGGSVTQDANGYIVLPSTGGGGGGGGGDSLSLIGQVTVQSTLNYYIVGGIWEYQGTKETNPGGGSASKSYNVYGLSGESSIKCQIINSGTNYAINTVYATVTGSVSITGYTYVISGNGTISISD